VLVALVGIALSSLTYAASESDQVSVLENTHDNDGGECAAAKRDCDEVIVQHTASKATASAKLTQCSKSLNQKQKKLNAYIARAHKDNKKLQELEGHARSLAARATEQEAEEEGMVMDDDDFGEGLADTEMSKVKGLPGIKDALQKAEAVLTYNEIQSDRLFKQADKMASDPQLLSSKGGMLKVKKAAKDAAKAASSRFVAEVQVTKLKAAMQAAEKVEAHAKKEENDSHNERLGASQSHNAAVKPVIPGAKTIAHMEKKAAAKIVQERADMFHKMNHISSQSDVAELGPGTN